MTVNQHVNQHRNPFVESFSLSVGENDDECQNPVRKALRRAEARPKNLAKSMEDITASLSPREHVLISQVVLSISTDHFGMIFIF